MKTIATIAATLLLSLGLLVAPANAEEPVTVPTIGCDELAAYVALVGPAFQQLADEKAALTHTVALLTDNLASRTDSEQAAQARAQAATRRADRLYAQNTRLQHRLFALRGQLRAMRQR